MKDAVRVALFIDCVLGMCAGCCWNNWNIYVEYTVDNYIQDQRNSEIRIYFNALSNVFSIKASKMATKSNSTKWKIGRQQT